MSFSFYHLWILRTFLISGSNSGLRVVGGFHKSLEQQKTVPPKSHPFSGVKSDQLVYWSFKLGWHPPVTRMVKLWETCQILCDRPQRDLFFPGLLAYASVASKKMCSLFSTSFEPLFAGGRYLRSLYHRLFPRKLSVLFEVFEERHAFRAVWGLWLLQCFGQWWVSMLRL